MGNLSPGGRAARAFLRSVVILNIKWKYKRNAWQFISADCHGAVERWLTFIMRRQMMRYHVSACLYNHVWAQWWPAINLLRRATPPNYGPVNEFFLFPSFSFYLSSFRLFYHAPKWRCTTSLSLFSSFQLAFDYPSTRVHSIFPFFLASIRINGRRFVRVSNELTLDRRGSFITR